MINTRRSTIPSPCEIYTINIWRKKKKYIYIYIYIKNKKKKKKKKKAERNIMKITLKFILYFSF